MRWSGIFWRSASTTLGSFLGNQISFKQLQITDQKQLTIKLVCKLSIKQYAQALTQKGKMQSFSGAFCIFIRED